MRSSIDLAGVEVEGSANASRSAEHERATLHLPWTMFGNSTYRFDW
jgi:hypothetical protein